MYLCYIHLSAGRHQHTITMQVGNLDVSTTERMSLGRLYKNNRPLKVIAGDPSCSSLNDEIGTEVRKAVANAETLEFEILIQVVAMFVLKQ